MIPPSYFWLTDYSEVTEWTANAEKLSQPAVEKSSVRNMGRNCKIGNWVWTSGKISWWVWVAGGGIQERRGVSLLDQWMCPAPACWLSFPSCCAPRLGWKVLKWSSRGGLDAVSPVRGCCVCPTHSEAMSRRFCSVTVVHIHGKLTPVSSRGSLHSWQ